MASLYAIWVPAVILAHILALVLFLYSLKQVSIVSIISASRQPGSEFCMNCHLTNLTTSTIYTIIGTLVLQHILHPIRSRSPIASRSYR